MKSYVYLNIQDDKTNRMIMVMSDADSPSIHNYNPPDDDLKCHCDYVFVIDTPEKFAKLWDFITSMDKEGEEMNEAVELIETMLSRSVDYWKKSDHKDAVCYAEAYATALLNVHEIIHKLSEVEEEE